MSGEQAKIDLRANRMTQDLREALAEQVAEWKEPPIDNVPELQYEEYSKFDVALSVQANCIDDLEELLQEHQE